MRLGFLRHIISRQITKPRYIATVLSSRRLDNINQDGAVFLDLKSYKKASVLISSIWQDHCEIDVLQGNDSITIDDDVDGQFINVSSSKMEEDHVSLCLRVPELFHVRIEANHLDLRIKNKIHGDVSVISSTGRIEVDKIRGMALDIQCPNSDVIVNKTIEGNISINSKSLSAKMVNGENVCIEAENDIQIGAVYGTMSVLKSTGAIKLDLLQGHGEVISEVGDVTIGGIDGSFRVHAAVGNISLQINKIKRLQSRSCEAVAVKGTLSVRVDPEVVACLKCNCHGSPSTRAGVSIISDAFELLGSDGIYKQPSGEEKLGSVVFFDQGVVQGRLTGASKSPKRPVYRGDRQTSGKISLGAAEAQSLLGLSEPTSLKPAAEAVATNGTNDPNGFVDHDLLLSSFGHLRVETLSWIEAIRRKHGFGEGQQHQQEEERERQRGDQSAGKKGSMIGRTASARERAQSLLQQAQGEDDTRHH